MRVTDSLIPPRTSDEHHAGIERGPTRPYPPVKREEQR